MDSPRLRNILLLLGIAAVSAWLLQFLWGLLSQIGVLVVTLLLAWIINLTALGPVRLLRRMHVPRWLAASFVYLGFAGLVALSSFFVLPPLFAQVGVAAGDLTDLAVRAPALLAEVQRQLTQFGVPDDFVDELITGLSGQLVNFGQSVASGVINATGTVLGGLAMAFLTLIISFYILLGWDTNLRQLRSVLPPSWLPRFDRGVASAERTFSGWLGGQALASMIWGSAIGLIYFVAGMPFGVLVAVGTGLLMFVPFVGLAIGIAVPVIMALTLRVDLAIWVGLAAGGVSLVIENAVKPRIMGSALGVNPMVVIVSVIVGGLAAGFWGIVFGIPIGALFWTFVRWSALEFLAGQQHAVELATGPAAPPDDFDVSDDGGVQTSSGEIEPATAPREGTHP